MYTEYIYRNSLQHHGTKGMHWGERRYQYKDGTYTQEGKDRRNSGIVKSGKSSQSYNYKLVKKKAKQEVKKNLSPEEKKARRRKIALATAGTVAAVGIGAYALKYKKHIDSGRKMTLAMKEQMIRSEAMDKQLKNNLKKAQSMNDTVWANDLQKHIKRNNQKLDIATSNYNELMKNKHNSKFISKKFDGPKVAGGKKVAMNMQSEMARHQTLDKQLKNKLQKAIDSGNTSSYIDSLNKKIERNNEKYNTAKSNYEELMKNKSVNNYINKNTARLVKRGKLRAIG